MTFTQTMTVHAPAAEPLADLLDGWHREQQGSAPGYRGARLLADEDTPGRFVIEVDFSSEKEASANNERSETQAWAEKLGSLAQGTPEYSNFTVAFETA
jgi:quinol monooxygenase YgiN